MDVYAKIQGMFRFEKLDLLVSLYIFCIAVSELMGGKTFFLATIWGYELNASVAILVLPFIFTINDVVTEVYGKERARSIVSSGLLVVFFILLFSIVATYLPASSRFRNESSYDTVFGLSIRIATSSLIAFGIADFLDVFIFVKLRQRMGKRALWLRNNVSNIISQFFDTTLFIFLAFYSFDKPFFYNSTFLISLILPYWLLKSFMSIIETPLVYVGVRWLKDKHTI